MKIDDIKIGTQLKIGFAIILLFGTILAVTAWKHTDRIASEVSRIYNHPLQVRRALGGIKADVLSIHRAMKDLVISESDQESEAILVEIEKFNADLFKEMEVLRNQYLGPKEDVESLNTSLVEWQSIREETIRLYRMKSIKAAAERTKRTGAGGEMVNQIVTNIEIIDKFAFNKGEELYLNANELNRSLNRQLVIVVLFIFISTIFVIYLLMRNIKRPLTELSSSTKRFIKGEIGSRSSYNSKNEFGELSRSYNELADVIEKEFILNKNSSKLTGDMLIFEDAHKFCHKLLSNIIELTNAQMGALYLLNEKESQFERFECLGMDESGCKPFSALNFEGEFGPAISTKSVHHIKSISPECRFTFSTVSGQFKPNEILTIPVVVEDVVVAVISLSTLNSFTDEDINLLNSTSNTLNARMSGILAYRKNIKISQLLEQQNSELEAQKNELLSMTGELTEQNRELDMQKVQLDRANRLKTTFLSNMSHELRTPLNSIIALSGVLNRRLEDKIPKEEYGYLDVITRNGKQLLDIINDILDLAKIEAGRDEINVKTFNLSELIAEVVEMITPVANQKGLKVIVSGEENLTLTTDFNKCRHILQNLMSNAVKFTDSGAVEISVKTKQESLILSVRDTGIGIEKDLIPFIFDEFRQADSSNTKRYGGSGLGLAIAKKYANLIGGDITVKSKKGEGSVFTITIPLTISGSDNFRDFPHDSVIDSQINESTNFVEERDPVRILLVEDTEAAIIQMKDILEEVGYTIDVALNGVEAVEQISKTIPDAMILDLMMPEMDGFEVLKNIREKEETSRLPVLILTAKYLSKEELSFLKHNNVHQLIHKGNVSREELINAIASLVKKSCRNI
ncbi:MAG: hybrid sensor histidine kinase/response regulator [Bacteroidetes bacterium HGW-Bacteroidetes-8]|jgi:signal transduction histidine kinase/CHASE3 domain sensor protein|nr:MAG: hybrid sensor histidine kinase/response regulator [Bacteroidetes bacterium HGW-Bacteroidetes-8]